MMEKVVKEDLQQTILVFDTGTILVELSPLNNRVIKIRWDRNACIVKPL